MKPNQTKGLFGTLIYSAGLIMALSATLSTPPKPWIITTGFVVMIVGYILQNHEQPN